MSVAGRFIGGAAFLIWVAYESVRKLRAARREASVHDEFRSLMPDEEWAEIERRALSAV